MAGVEGEGGDKGVGVCEEDVMRDGTRGVCCEFMY